MGHEYDGQFCDYTDRSAVRTAETIVPIVVESLGCVSVLDVGYAVSVVSQLSIWRRQWLARA